MTKKREPGVGKRDTFGEGRADQQHGRGFVRAFGGEACGGIFGFAEDIGNFVFTADVSEALDFSGARSGQENGSAGSELGLDIRHAGNDVTVETRAGARGELELRRGTDSEGKLLDVDLRSFFQRGGEFHAAVRALLT